MATILIAKMRNEQQETFNLLNDKKSLKEALVSPPVQGLTNTTGHITLNTEACVVYAGGVLLQAQLYNTTTSLRYCSRSLKDAKRKNSTAQLECLASVSVVLVLRP